MFKRILVPTDDSPLARKAIRSAVSLASSVGSELVALHVVPRYPMAFFEGGANVSPEEIARTEQEWTQRGEAIAGAASKAAARAGVNAKAITLHSDHVAEGILAAARKNKCDLVVMGSHGRTGLKRLLLGSETQHVLTHGVIPVLVLR